MRKTCGFLNASISFVTALAEVPFPFLATIANCAKPGCRGLMVVEQITGVPEHDVGETVALDKDWIN